MKVGYIFFACLLALFGNFKGVFAANKTCTSSGVECKFPFTYGGRNHSECLASLAGNWCGIKSNVLENKHGKDWGYCDNDCSKPGEPRCTAEGYQCVWPYTDEHGHTHTGVGCIYYRGTWSNYYWCPVVANYNASANRNGGPRQWGKCADSCPQDGPKPFPTQPPTTTTMETTTIPKTTATTTTTVKATIPTTTTTKTNRPSVTESTTTVKSPTITVTTTKTADSPSIAPLIPLTTTTRKITTTPTPPPSPIPPILLKSSTKPTTTPSNKPAGTAGSEATVSKTPSKKNNEKGGKGRISGEESTDNANADPTTEDSQLTDGSGTVAPRKTSSTPLVIVSVLLFILAFCSVALYLFIKRRRRQKAAKDEEKANEANKETSIPLVERKSSNSDVKDPAAPLVEGGDRESQDSSPSRESVTKVPYVTTDSGYGSQGKFPVT